jgi:hypothetical protein
MNCSKCNSANSSNSTFCVTCGAALISGPSQEISTNTDTKTSTKSVLMIIPAVMAVMLMGFGMVMFIVFGFFTDAEGKFWFQGGLDTVGEINETYGKCKDASSSLSLVFFNINTDSDRFRECLREESRHYIWFSEKEINRFDIPAEFKEILIDVKRHEIGEYKKAIEDYTEAIRLDPLYALGYHNRGVAYYQLGEYQEAIKDYDEAIRLDPLYASAYLNRYFAYYELGQHEKAAQDYKKYEDTRDISTKPTFEGLRNQLDAILDAIPRNRGGHKGYD